METLGEFVVETTPISRRQSKVIVRQGEATICWLDCWGKRVERHIVPEYRNQFKNFLRQWRTVNGNKFPFTY